MLLFLLTALCGALAGAALSPIEAHINVAKFAGSVDKWDTLACIEYLRAVGFTREVLAAVEAQQFNGNVLRSLADPQAEEVVVSRATTARSSS